MRNRRVGTILLACAAAAVLLAGCNGKETQNNQTSVAASTEQGEKTTKATQTTVNPEDVAEQLTVAAKPKFAKEDVRGVSVVKDGKIQYQLNYTPQDDKESYLFWDMLTPYASTAVINTEEMYYTYNILAEMNLAKTKTVDVSAKKAGVKDTDTYILLNYYKKDKESDTQQAQPNQTFTILVGNKKGSDNYYCALKGKEDQVFLLQQVQVDHILNRDPYGMILKIPYVLNVASVSEVDINCDGKDYKMTLDGSTYKLNRKKVDSDTYCTLFSALMQPMIESEIPEGETLSTDRQPYISIQYKRNMDSVKDYDVKIYSYKDDKYTISVNGEENFILSKEDVDTLVKTIQDAF